METLGLSESSRIKDLFWPDLKSEPAARSACETASMASFVIAARVRERSAAFRETEGGPPGRSTLGKRSRTRRPARSGDRPPTGSKFIECSIIVKRSRTAPRAVYYKPPHSGSNG